MVTGYWSELHLHHNLHQFSQIQGLPKFQKTMNIPKILTYEPCFYGSNISTMDFRSSNPIPVGFLFPLFPPLESWDEDEVVEVLQTDLWGFRAAPFFTPVEKIWESLLFRFRLQPFWEEKKHGFHFGLIFIIIHNNANLNSQANLLLKWFVKTMI